MKIDALQQKSKELQRQILAYEQRTAAGNDALHSLGCLDALLPSGGVRAGSLVEWIGDEAARGAVTLSLLAARAVCHEKRPIVLIDTQHDVFAWALKNLGFDLSQLLMVRPSSPKEALWACEQALLCEAVGLVWARVDQLNTVSFRRLQLAARASASVGFLVRDHTALRYSSWADARLAIKPQPACGMSHGYRVEAINSHGRADRLSIDVTLDCLKGTLHEKSTNSLSLVSKLDAAETMRRQARA